MVTADRTARSRTKNRVPLYWPSKDANEVVEYAVDFSDRLGRHDYLTSATFSLTTAAGLAIDSSDHDGKSTATVVLSAGTEGGKAEILCRVVTNDGNTLDESLSLLIKAR